MTNIVYMPESIAERPSALREEVYQDGRPMPLPVLDPGGWKLLPPVETVGSLIPEATVTAQLSIASPVRLGYSHLLTSANFVFFSWNSCHLLWAHRYHYSSIYVTMRVLVLISTRSTFVSSVLLSRAVSPAESASLTLRVPCSGMCQAPLLAG
jgi:hypothetical protein